MIFITEGDYFKKGLPLYRIRRFIEEDGSPFDDGNHIIYVNDARLAKRIAMKDPKVTYTAAGLKAGDLDGNGKITINEARRIKRMVLE